MVTSHGQTSNLRLHHLQSLGEAADDPAAMCTSADLVVGTSSNLTLFGVQPFVSREVGSGWDVSSLKLNKSRFVSWYLII